MPLARLRTPLVLLPLLGLLLVAAAVGAGKLWADLPEREAAAADVTCWDGTTAPLAECTPPRGEEGLRWVFPSLRADDPRCAEVRRPASDKRPRPFEVSCDLRVDRRPVTVTYSVRTSLDQGLAFLRRSYRVPPEQQPGGGRVLFAAREPDDDDLWSLTVAYLDHPYSVTVEAVDRDLRDTALAELVRFRPATQVLARP